MTPSEQRMADLVQHSGDDIVASLDRKGVPTNLAFAISVQVAITLLDRMDPEMREDISAALIARFTASRHLNA